MKRLWLTLGFLHALWVVLFLQLGYLCFNVKHDGWMHCTSSVGDFDQRSELAEFLRPDCLPEGSQRMYNLPAEYCPCRNLRANNLLDDPFPACGSLGGHCPWSCCRQVSVFTVGRLQRHQTSGWISSSAEACSHPASGHPPVVIFRQRELYNFHRGRIGNSPVHHVLSTTWGWPVPSSMGTWHIDRRPLRSLYPCGIFMWLWGHTVP